jgi:hypothetical protein
MREEAFSRALLACLASLSCLTAAHAQTGAASAPPGRPLEPPPEAIAACTGRTEGTQVSFTGRGGQTVSGVCRKVGDVLAAKPAGGPPGGGPAPR